jgi:hypothetical protein
VKAIYEIFEEFEQRKTKEDRLAVLRYNSNWTLKSVLKGAFDPNVQFDVEIPAYKPSDDPPGLSPTSLSQELDRAYIFEKNNPKVAPGLTKERKTQILIQMLEALESKEAKVLEGVLTKKLKVKGLTYDLVKEAFPDILP